MPDRDAVSGADTIRRALPDLDYGCQEIDGAHFYMVAVPYVAAHEAHDSLAALVADLEAAEEERKKYMGWYYRTVDERVAVEEQVRQLTEALTEIANAGAMIRRGDLWFHPSQVAHDALAAVASPGATE